MKRIKNRLRRLTWFLRSATTNIPTFSNPNVAQINTATTNDVSADGLSWSNPILIDNYGNLIVSIQRHNGGNKYHAFMYNNGDAWTINSQTENFLSRAAVAIDKTNGVIHALWKADAATGGIIYRRYVINYSGNDITSITKDTNVNLQLDFQLAGVVQYEHPSIIFMGDAAFGTYGALLATWSIRNPLLGNEVRSSMCTLNATADAGKLAINWYAPVTTDVSLIGNAAAVPSSTLVTNATASNIYPKLTRVSTKHVYLFYHDGGNVADGKWYVRRMQWNSGNNTFSTGLTAPQLISNEQVAGINTGYALKKEIGSHPIEDGNGRVYFAFPRWLSNALGDTVSLINIQGDTLGTLLNIASYNGAHSYAPASDIIYSSNKNCIIISQISTTDQDIYLTAVRENSIIKPATLVFDDAPCDIPLLYTTGNTITVLFRDTINTPTPPYHTWYGVINL